MDAIVDEVKRRLECKIVRLRKLTCMNAPTHRACAGFCRCAHACSSPSLIDFVLTAGLSFVLQGKRRLRKYRRGSYMPAESVTHGAATLAVARAHRILTLLPQVLSFLAGLIAQDLRVTMAVFGLGFVLALVVRACHHHLNRKPDFISLLTYLPTHYSSFVRLGPICDRISSSGFLTNPRRINRAAPHTSRARGSAVAKS